MATGDSMWQCPFCFKTHYTVNGCSCTCEGWKDLFNKPFSAPAVPIIPTCPDVVMIDENDGNPPVITNNNTVMETGNSCPVCGGDMVSIRGKYPNSPKRIVCPTCLADKIDMIRELTDPKRGMGSQEKK